MRDRRFIAKHRGGPLDVERHRMLVGWAAECAEHVLRLFEQNNRDDRPKHAIQMARAWAKGDVSVGIAQRAAWAAHAAAREAEGMHATEAARAAGHAAAAAHMADHSLGGAIYALRAVEKIGGSIESERDWQIKRLPKEVRDLVLSAWSSDRLRRFAPGNAAQGIAAETHTSRR